MHFQLKEVGMREMSRKEMLDFIAEWRWGTVIGVEGDRPYAIEVAYASDDAYLYCGSRPGGRMAQCIKANANAAFKICDSDPEHRKWRAVIVEGKAERLTGKRMCSILSGCSRKRWEAPSIPSTPWLIK